MKMPSSLYQLLKDAIKVVFEGRQEPEFTQFYADKTPKRKIWDLFWLANYDLRYDDTHPAFANHGRKRRVAYNASYAPALNELKDAHIDTALKNIAKELGI